VLVSDGEQITYFSMDHNLEMEESAPRIIEALRMRDGVIITFEDDEVAFYSADILYAMLAKTDKLVEDPANQD
jgi:hypothetical protein